MSHNHTLPALPLATRRRNTRLRAARIRSARRTEILRRADLRRVARGLAPLFAGAAVLAVPGAAFADPGVAVLAANSLPQVISNVQLWIMGLLAALATLYLILGGVLRATAGGDPSQVEKANGYFKNALMGYAAAILAPVFLEIVKSFVGG